MATIRNAAQYVLDDARDGISWIVLWKAGRSWESAAVYLDYDEKTNTAKLDDTDYMETLQHALATDPNAIIVNSNYHNLGVFEGYVTRDNLADALRWQYELQSATLADFMENIVQTEQSPVTDAEQNTADELNKMHKWEQTPRAVTLTNDQWSTLACYILMSTKYRTGERDAWQKLAEEKHADGTAVFKSAASNAEYWQSLCDKLDAMLPILDGTEI